ncbi:hypothetical protein H8B02_11750 [Bradyrhizobium sp. Pear77]|uniref:hypothetical protein n=1 Tax=Bradyrhizobium altum TaxID=1571202 RepID=UPI001E288917|nr:hypothetical protein [Bradyrhizobium altum]MCC8954110.1 hypothetical protein [Bradyrhizobium altum]
MRNLEIVILCVAAIGLGACDVTSGNSFVGPSGATVNTAKCSQSSDACFKKAAATCGGSYQVINSESHAGGAFADAVEGPITWYVMTYQCGPSDGRMPTFAFRGGPTVNANVNIHQQ